MVATPLLRFMSALRISPADWREGAECRRRINKGEAVAAWWDIPEGGPLWSPERLTAVRICHRCPVRAECLQERPRASGEGIWGGVHFDGRGKAHTPSVAVWERVGL